MLGDYNNFKFVLKTRKTRIFVLFHTTKQFSHTPMHGFPLKTKG